MMMFMMGMVVGMVMKKFVWDKYIMPFIEKHMTMDLFK